MEDLDDIIRFENESTTVDFKATQYRRQQHEALLLDVMAMANADTSDPRHIVVGVKLEPGGKREIVGLPADGVVDPAVYDQLVRENIEPDVGMEYFFHEHGGVRLGVFRIALPREQPYLMRKDYKGLRRGEGYVRKGTSQALLVRSDLERIYRARHALTMQPALRVGFPGGQKRQTVAASDAPEQPSVAAAKRIQELLEALQAGEEARSPTTAEAVSALLASKPYELMNRFELETALRNVGNAHRAEDDYAWFEDGASHVQVQIANDGEIYVEDATIWIELEARDGLVIADRIYPAPRNYRFAVPPEPAIGRPNYPEVHLDGNRWLVSSHVGVLKHHVLTLAFDNALRMKADSTLIGKEIELRCTVLGRELRSPVREVLVLEVVEPRG